MRVLRYERYDEIEISEDITLLQEEILARLIPILNKKYNVKADQRREFRIGWAFRRQLKYILASLSGDLREKTLVDLGCGSIRNMDDWPNYDGMFEPWLCRGLHFLPDSMNVRVIGVDKSEELKGESFENHVGDIIWGLPYPLDNLPSQSIDLVNASSLFSSRHFYGGRSEVRRKLLPQLERILKPTGVFVYGSPDKSKGDFALT